MFMLQVNERDLRYNKLLQSVVPRCKTQFAERNFAYRGAVHLNVLPTETKSASSADSFKERIKKLRVDY